MVAPLELSEDLYALGIALYELFPGSAPLPYG